mmetsp:Transcript_16956/g.19963  ORF Transcript_16956/g.19963 Transcript_16956/m.19963 type:complete len:224 (+) Transcript_16956:143-814(+)
MLAQLHDRAEMVPGDRGRRKIAQNGCEESMFRPQRRFLCPNPSTDDSIKTSGKKMISTNFGSQDYKRSEARHNIAADMRSGYDGPEVSFPSKPKAAIPWPGKTSNAKNFISSERSLEVECGIKHKVLSRSQLRNEITQRNPGDKAYGHVEYSPGFFKGEIIQDSKTLHVTQYGTIDASNGINFRPQPSYETKKKTQILQNDIDGVMELKQPVGGEDSESDDEY